MLASLLFGLFFLAPASPCREVSLTIYGRTHTFPRVIYSGIRPATLKDAAAIASLSCEMPSIYPESTFAQRLPFRRTESYQRLLAGSDLKSRVRKRYDAFFVFKDAGGHIQAYIHGCVYKHSPSATIDEVVVSELWRDKGVARALTGRLLVEFERLGKTFVHIMARTPISERLSTSFQIPRRKQGYQLSLVMDYLLSRVSLNYLAHQNHSQVTLLAERAQKIKTILGQAKQQDVLRTHPAMRYLSSLARAADRNIRARFIQEGEAFYSGIQDDKIDLAHIYFLMYLFSVLAQEDTKSQDVLYYQQRSSYFEKTVAALRAAQKEGGLLPSDIQIYIARLHAFARFFEGYEKGSLDDQRWVYKAVVEYLRLIDLKEVQGRQVALTPKRIEIALCEMLWFRYPYDLALKIAAKMMKAVQEAEKTLRASRFTLEQREQYGIGLFQQIQSKCYAETGILLEPEFGLMFLYVLPIYNEKEEEQRQRCARLFSQCSFYRYDSVKKEWRSPPAPLDLFTTLGVKNLAVERSL